MSGPKKADVVAALDIAKGFQQKCERFISGVESGMIESLLRETENILRRIEVSSKELQNAIDSLTPSIRRISGSEVSDALGKARKSLDSSEKTRSLRDHANETMNRMREIERKAGRIYETANQEYKKTADALRNAGSHYLHQEMEWAQKARQLYEEAGSTMGAASNLRGEAEQKARQALNRAKESLASVEQERNNLQAVRAEGEARLRAEEEARRITEQKRREAVIAVEKAKASIQRLEELPHRKFQPDGGRNVVRLLTTAQESLRDDRFDNAISQAIQAGQEANRLIEMVGSAWQEFQRRKAEAEGELQALRITLDKVDKNLIKDWADDPIILQRVEETLSKSYLDMENERFDQVVECAKQTNEELKRCLHNAAENQSLNEKRNKIGEAIMDSLEELGFDISYQAGNKKEQLKIVGQTPDVNGRGDFSIDIPLDGNVNFEVNALQGDTTCVAAVQELQKRLSEKGIHWETTNWGHAEGVTFSGVKNKSQIQEKQKKKG